MKTIKLIIIVILAIFIGNFVSNAMRGMHSEKAVIEKANNCKKVRQLPYF